MVMARSSGTRDILIATANPGKSREIAAVLTAEPAEGALARVRWRSLSEFAGRIDAPAEDGDTFEQNAAIKARYYARFTGLWTLADDSGLEVDALAGAPGVRSARYAGAQAGASREVADGANNRKLIAALSAVPFEKRTARFRCALALADGDRILLTAEGVIEGRIVDDPRGRNGFGYDPHFYLPELGRTTAELAAEHKNRISHRGQALRSLRESLRALLEAG